MRYLVIVRYWVYILILIDLRVLMVSFKKTKQKQHLEPLHVSVNY